MHFPCKISRKFHGSTFRGKLTLWNKVEQLSFPFSRRRFGVTKQDMENEIFAEQRDQKMGRRRRDKNERGKYHFHICGTKFGSCSIFWQILCANFNNKILNVAAAPALLLPLSKYWFPWERSLFHYRGNKSSAGTIMMELVRHKKNWSVFSYGCIH